MATSPSNQPIRSISLPSRPHPLVSQIDEHFSILRSSKIETTSESQLSSLAHKLSNLKDLYDCLDDLIHLPQNQSKLVQTLHCKRVDELLDGSLRLLDVCGIAKDALSQMKEHIQEIQSSLRRKSNGELSIGDEIDDYVNTRKVIKAMSKRCLKEVKGMVKRFGCQGCEKNNDEVVDVLRRVEGVTAEIFESLFEVVCGSKPQSYYKRSANLTSLIMCKFIMYYQNVAFEKLDVVSVNEFEDVDVTLSSLIGAQKKRSCIDVTQAENLRNQMVRLENYIQDLDEVLEGLFRCLVKNRATLLNILTH